ncbi:MAG TPA: 6,7-dimethyl-8-ribityllumazine synthase [Flavipsychrobacter sp.]|nr:6,7-dimethyl-8-ribityllumazine synthase [Flavipsychrobacter sp.]
MAQSQNSESLFNTHSLQALSNAKLAVVYTEWNDKIVAEQIRGCERIVQQFIATIVEKIAVPGSFELPFGCRSLWNYYESQSAALRPEAIIAFGAVIRGGTPHFEYVCKAVTEGITQLNLTLPIPVIFGVLTLDNETQAWERLGGVHGHKGEEAALTALKMIQICRRGEQ